MRCEVLLRIDGEPFARCLHDVSRWVVGQRLNLATHAWGPCIVCQPCAPLSHEEYQLEHVNFFFRIVAVKLDRPGTDASWVSTAAHASPHYSSYCPPGTISLPFSSMPLRYSYTVNVTACPGATRITRGVIPFQKLFAPSCFHISLDTTLVESPTHVLFATYPAIDLILVIALTPGSAGVFCSLVLIVSIGALEKGPQAPEIRPMHDVCHPGRSVVP